ncbi:hypothetical protein AVEN_253808-1 [Araneus ventricosus]|uniref:Uncharacterized protein n=1 Tax=Araneus ventricosus TaxID=182803 RepID=A0A4Y2QVK9_ARAVE|nr:hypothetical protein AVEN_112565-1 [Araneus ventricosus]GBN67344.1 hypothetical protein AVEN_253808-1 [Araneus ventricosus]
MQHLADGFRLFPAHRLMGQDTQQNRRTEIRNSPAEVSFVSTLLMALRGWRLMRNCCVSSSKGKAKITPRRNWQCSHFYKGRTPPCVVYWEVEKELGVDKRKTKKRKGKKTSMGS